MLAAVLHQPGQLAIEQRTDPVCPEIGVVIQVKACGICASDARMVATGHPALDYPRIPGHEIAGLVVQSRDKAWREGDRVQVAPGLRCGQCRHCRRGQDQRCLERQILGFSRDGGFSQYVAVPTAGPLVGAITALGPHTGFDLATLIEPMACCLHAQDNLNLNAGQSVVIIGAGPLGLLHLVLAKQRAAGPIGVVDPLAHRRDAALSLGADRVLEPLNAEKMAADTDVLILAAGNVFPSPRLLAALGRGVRIGVFSGPGGDRVVDPAWVHYNEVTLTGTYGCGATHNKQAAAVVDRCGDSLQMLITSRTGLTRIRQGLDHTASCSGLKAIVEVADE